MAVIEKAAWSKGVGWSQPPCKTERQLTDWTSRSGGICSAPQPRSASGCKRSDEFGIPNGRSKSDSRHSQNGDHQNVFHMATRHPWRRASASGGPPAVGILDTRESHKNDLNGRFSKTWRAASDPKRKWWLLRGGHSGKPRFY